MISEAVLQKLLKQNVIINFHLTDPAAEECFIFKAGKQSDYFVLILQGRVQVELGKKTFVFEAGPFMHFGVQALPGV